MKIVQLNIWMENNQKRFWCDRIEVTRGFNIN